MSMTTFNSRNEMENKTNKITFIMLKLLLKNYFKGFIFILRADIHIPIPEEEKRKNLCF